MGETRAGHAATIGIRRADPSDGAHIPALIHAAGPEIYDYIFRDGAQKALDFIAAEFRTGAGLCGHRAVSAAVEDGVVVGVACVFDAAEHNRLLRGTLQNIVTVYGMRRSWSVLARAQHVAPVITRPGPGELCLCNLAVAPGKRGRGIGTALLEHGIAVARARGHRRFVLDVAETNPRAAALYARLGLRPEQSARCRDPRAAAHVPGSTRMALTLAPR
jgi:ribosomal protein S18 acetylase RimI-like enzyme